MARCQLCLKCFKKADSEEGSLSKSMHESLGIQVDEKVGPVDDYFTPGTKAGLENLEAFARTRLKAYGTSRNLSLIHI